VCSSDLPYPPFTWLPGVFWFVFKALVCFFMFAMAKAIVPRYRYDQLMQFGWKWLFPAAVLNLIVTAAAILYFNV